MTGAADPPPHGPRFTTLISAVAALAVVAALVLGVVAVRALNQRDRGDDDRSEVRQAASQLVLAVFDYDYRDLDRTLERVRELAGDPYRDRFAEGFPVFSERIVEQQAVGSVEIQDIFLTEIDRGTAEAIVVISLNTTLGRPASGSQPDPLPNEYVRLALNRDDDGAWRVIDLVALQRTPLLPTGPAAGPTAGAPE